MEESFSRENAILAVILQSLKVVIHMNFLWKYEKNRWVWLLNSRVNTSITMEDTVGILSISLLLQYRYFLLHIYIIKTMLGKWKLWLILVYRLKHGLLSRQVVSLHPPGCQKCLLLPTSDMSMSLIHSLTLFSWCYKADKKFNTVWALKYYAPSKWANLEGKYNSHEKCKTLKCTL